MSFAYGKKTKTKQHTDEQKSTFLGKHRRKRDQQKQGKKRDPRVEEAQN